MPRTTRVPENETAEAKFARLAVARTQRCLDTIGLIGNLASGQYAKTPEQVEAIFGTIRGMLDATESKFHGQKDGRPKFSL